MNRQSVTDYQIVCDLYFRCVGNLDIIQTSWRAI